MLRLFFSSLKSVFSWLNKSSPPAYSEIDGSECAPGTAWQELRGHRKEKAIISPFEMSKPPVPGQCLAYPSRESFEPQLWSIFPFNVPCHSYHLCGFDSGGLNHDIRLQGAGKPLSQLTQVP